MRHNSRNIFRSIKVLMDLEREGNTFFYRHVGPNGPKEVYSRDAPFRKINFNLTFCCKCGIIKVTNEIHANIFVCKFWVFVVSYTKRC